MKKLEDIELTPSLSIKILMSLLVFVISLTVIFGSFYIVSAGERVVLVTLGSPDPIPRTEGLHFKVPIIQKAVHMDVKTQKYEADASAASADLQTVSTKIAVNYHVSPEATTKLYQEIGLDYQARILQPAVQEAVKAATAQFTAEELITKRTLVKDQIVLSLQNRLSERSITVEDVSITDFDFSDSFNSAIEAKVTAEQNALAAKNKLAQVEYEAQQRITQAKAEAEAIKIQAEAIQAQGGKEYVDLQAINKWNGILPQFTGSGGIPFINFNSNNGGNN